MKKYIVIDDSDKNYTYATTYEGEAAMLKGVKDSEVDKIKVYEITAEIKLEARPRILMISDNLTGQE